VSQHRLNGTQIRSSVQQVRGERVPQRVWVDARLGGGMLGPDPKSAPHIARREPATALGEEKRRILVRYLGKLSPLGEVRAAGPDRICATDFARLREIAAPASFRYTIIERGGGRTLELPAEVGAGGAVCFRPRGVVTGALRDADPQRIVRFEIANGTRAGPLVIQAYDLGRRGMQIAGLTRPGP